MKSWKTLCITLTVFAVSACVVLPARDAQVENARAAVLAAQSDPQVVTLAPVELSQAVEAMRRTDVLWQERAALEDVHHLAYLASTRAAIASETARLKAAEGSIASATAERDRARLEARTRDAERAQRNAQLARQNAQVAQAQADASRRDAMQAQQQAQSAQQQAEAARQQAQNAQSRALSLEATLRELQAQPTDRGMVVTLGDVLFDSGRAQLRPGGLRVVDRLAEFMREYPQRRVSIEGFTDSVGNFDSNQVLSERRASAVRLALIDRGVDPARIVTRGYGEEYPVASNENVAGRQINRRVEIVISDEQGMIGARSSPPVATIGRRPRG